MSLETKINSIKQKMANLSPNSPLYSNYQILIRDLEMELPKQQVVLHVEGGPVCESCQ